MRDAFDCNMINREYQEKNRRSFISASTDKFTSDRILAEFVINCGEEWDIPAIQARNICTCPSLDGRSNILILLSWTLREWCTIHHSHHPVVCGQEYVHHPVDYGQVQVFLPAADEWCINSNP